MVAGRATGKPLSASPMRFLSVIYIPESDDRHSVGVDGPRRHQGCQNEVAVDLRQRRPSVEQIRRMGTDTSKHIFLLHGVNTTEEPVLRKKLRRKEMFAFLEKLAPTVIAIEACGASHHCARLLQSFGHSVKLITPQLVKPYISARLPAPRPNDLKPTQLTDYVWGVTMLADRSIRAPGSLPGGPLNFGFPKNFDTSCSLGPCIAVGEADPTNIHLETLVNGERRQRFNTRDMVFSFGE